MNNSIKIFENPEFGQVRVLLEDGEPLFCLADVCSILELRVTDVKNRLEEEVVSIYPLPTNGGVQQLTFVNEEGFYSVVLGSRKESVKPFKKWVTSEVLPSIRRTGSYSVRPLSPAELIIAQGQAMLALEQKQREQEMKIQGLSQDVDELKRVRIEAEQQLKALPLSEEKTPEKSLRAVVNKLARQYQRLTGCEYTEVWNKAYKDLYYKYGISVNGIKEAKKGESKLSKLERKGHLEEVKIILSEMIRDGGVN
jgi:putative antirepressor